MFTKSKKNSDIILKSSEKKEIDEQGSKLILDGLIASIKNRRGSQRIQVPDDLFEEENNANFEEFIKQKIKAKHLIQKELFGEKNWLKLFNMLSEENQKKFFLNIKKYLEKTRVNHSDLTEEEKKLWKSYSQKTWVSAKSNDPCPDLQNLPEKLQLLLKNYYENQKRGVTTESAKYFKIKKSLRGNNSAKTLPEINDLTPEHQADIRAIFQKKQENKEKIIASLPAKREAARKYSRIKHTKEKQMRQIREELNEKPVELLTDEERQIKKKYNDAYLSLQKTRNAYAKQLRIEKMKIIKEAELCKDLSTWDAVKIKQLKYAQLFKLREIFNHYLKTKKFLENPESAPLPESIKDFLPEVRELAEIHFNAKRNNFLGRHNERIENTEECSINNNSKSQIFKNIDSVEVAVPEKINKEFLYDLTAQADISILQEYIKNRDQLGGNFELILPDSEVNNALCVMDSGKPLHLGLCALESFEPGQFIADYEGEQYGPFLNRKNLEEKVNSLENTDYLLEFKKDKKFFLVDARQKRSLAAFANSKENANAAICMVNNKVCIVATSQIEPGEQIFIRYDFPNHYSEKELNKLGTSLFALIARVVSLKLNLQVEPDEIKATFLGDAGRSASLRNHDDERLFFSVSVIKEWLSTLQPDNSMQEKINVNKKDMSSLPPIIPDITAIPIEDKQEMSKSSLIDSGVSFFKPLSIMPASLPQVNKRKNAESPRPLQVGFYPRYPGGRRFAPRKIYLPLIDVSSEKAEKKHRK